MDKHATRLILRLFLYQVPIYVSDHPTDINEQSVWQATRAITQCHQSNCNERFIYAQPEAPPSERESRVRALEVLGREPALKPVAPATTLLSINERLHPA
jgi:hypothetical protein